MRERHLLTISLSNRLFNQVKPTRFARTQSRREVGGEREREARRAAAGGEGDRKDDLELASWHFFAVFAHRGEQPYPPSPCRPLFLL